MNNSAKFSQTNKKDENNEKTIMHNAWAVIYCLFGRLQKPKSEY